MIVNLNNETKVGNKLKELKELLASAAVPFRVILLGGVVIRANATKMTKDRLIATEGRGSSCLIALSDIFDIDF